MTASTPTGGGAWRGWAGRSAWVVVACALGGCTLLLREDENQCSRSEDCAGLGQAFAGSLCVEGRCVQQGVIPGDAGAGGAPAACTRTSDCRGALGQDAICRQQQCVRLTSETCPRLIGQPSDEEGFVVGLLAPLGDQGQAYFANGLVTAVEVAHKTYEQNRPMVSLAAPAVVVCDESQGAGAAVKRLIDVVGAQVIMGPVLDQNLAAVLNETRSKGVVVVSPTVDDPGFVAQANDSGLLWSCRRNRERVVPYYAGAVEHAIEVFGERRQDVFAGGVRAVMVAPSDPSTKNFLTAVEPSLTFAGAAVAPGVNYARVDYSWSPSAPTDFALVGGQVIGALGGPNLVLIPTSIDNVSGLIDRIEGGWPAGAPRPSYLVDEHADGVVSLVEGAAGLRGRLLGLRPRRDADSLAAYDAFVASFKTEFGQGTVPQPRSEYGFDCFYEIVYAVALGRSAQTGALDASGASFRAAVASLSGPGLKITVGPSNVANFFGSLSVRRDFDLVGATGPLSYFNPAKGYPDAEGEIYCVDGVTKTFCGTGVTFSPQPGGAKTVGPTACQCE